MLKPGEAGKTKIVVKGGKENLAASPMGFAPRACWEAMFETASSVTDVSLRAKSAAP